MKALHLLMLAGAVIAATPLSALEIGDSPEAVTREMGAPAGHIRTGARDLFIYERGEVEFRSNAVSRFEIVSQEEALLRKQARALAAENNRRWAESQRLAIHQQGVAELARHREDPAFSSLPASAQVAYWKKFRRRFPSVDVKDEYAESLRLLELDLKEQRLAEEQQRQMRALEQRVAAAEERALAAERYARRQTIYLNDWNTIYPVSYAYPVTVVRRAACYPVRPTTYCAPVRSDGLTISFGGSSTLVRGNVGLVRN